MNCFCLWSQKKKKIQHTTEIDHITVILLFALWTMRRILTIFLVSPSDQQGKQSKNSIILAKSKSNVSNKASDWFTFSLTGSLLKIESHMCYRSSFQLLPRNIIIHCIISYQLNALIKWLWLNTTTKYCRCGLFILRMFTSLSFPFCLLLYFSQWFRPNKFTYCFFHLIGHTHNYEVFSFWGYLALSVRNIPSFVFIALI